MTSVPARLYADLIGKPFAPGGRGPAEYDCVGLAIELQRRRGFVVPAYLSDVAELHRQVAHGMLADAQRLQGPEAGCVVLFRSTGEAGRHLGVMLDPFHVVHASEVTGNVVVESLSRSYWGRRVVGFYRMEPA